jgi:hypothetical protein
MLLWNIYEVKWLLFANLQHCLMHRVLTCLSPSPFPFCLPKPNFTLSRYIKASISMSLCSALSGLGSCFFYFFGFLDLYRWDCRAYKGCWYVQSSRQVWFQFFYIFSFMSVVSGTLEVNYALGFGPQLEIKSFHSLNNFSTIVVNSLVVFFIFSSQSNSKR